MKFSAALLANIEIFIIGEKASTNFVDTARRVSKKSYSNKLMDEDDINYLVQRCQKLKDKFRGVFAADSFPSKLKSNTFLKVNASKSESPGTHWLLICKKNDHLLIADPLGRSLSSFQKIYQRLAKNNLLFHQLLENQPIQSQNSELCRFFCVFNAHFIFEKKQIVQKWTC